MAFLVSDVIDRMRKTGLDAEGTDFYDVTRDYIPSINSALTWLISVVDYAFGQSKISEEVFRELTLARVYQTSLYSRIQLPSTVWTILDVVPLPITKPNQNILAVVNDYTSLARPDLVHVESTVKSATRLTKEEYEHAKEDPLAPGNTKQDAIVEYGYLNFFDHSYPGSPAVRIIEIEIRPFIKRKLVTLFYVERHAALTLQTDTIRFNDKLFNMLMEKALQIIVRKQADQTTIDGVTERDVNTLVTALRLV